MSDQSLNDLYTYDVTPTKFKQSRVGDFHKILKSHMYLNYFQN